MGAGWAWDADNALGFAALAGMLFLCIPGGARRSVSAHQSAGYAVLALTLIHALWFLLDDGAAVEFIKPDAPAYMWTGIIGIVLLCVLVVLAMMPTRLTAHRSYQTFRKWHQITAFIAIACMLHHTIASGFYLRTWWQAVLLPVFALVAMFGRGIWGTLGQSPRVTPRNLLAISFIGAVVFTGIRNLEL